MFCNTLNIFISVVKLVYIFKQDLIYKTEGYKKEFYTIFLQEERKH